MPPKGALITGVKNVMALIILAMTFFTPVISAPLGGIQAFGWASVSGMSWGVVRLVVGGALVCFVAASAKWALVGQGVGVLCARGYERRQDHFPSQADCRRAVSKDGV